MAKIIAVVNQKGGTGKTTTVANLAIALRARGRRVLAVDVDPQASLTFYFGQSALDTREHRPRQSRCRVDGGAGIVMGIEGKLGTTAR